MQARQIRRDWLYSRRLCRCGLCYGLSMVINHTTSSCCTAFQALVVVGNVFPQESISPHCSGWIAGYGVVTGPAKRNLTMRCIIQAFPLSKAPAHWLLNHLAEPIMVLIMLCSQAGPLEVATFANYTSSNLAHFSLIKSAVLLLPSC